VVQVTVAVLLDPAADTEEMTGAVVSAMTKLRGGSVATGSVVELPAASAEVTR
jgi:hypothetical protein